MTATCSPDDFRIFAEQQLGKGPRDEAGPGIPASSRPCRTGALAVLASMLVAPGAHAAASYTDVWFPTGEISYEIGDDAETARDTIEETMRYMTEHSPLEIEEAGSFGAANLHFAADWTAPNYGGVTPGYWEENMLDDLRTIITDPTYLPDRGTIAHEFGHALGRAHEFQRDDRDSHVDVCFNVDPFNYSKMGSAYFPDSYYNLSPYDYASVMNDGYDSCVTPWPGADEQSRGYDGITNLLSIHDINGIYRMYGKALGANNDGDHFGVAVASGDYDDDGYADVAVATLQDSGLWLSFFRGVYTDNSEGVEGLLWMPWFKVCESGPSEGCVHAESVSADEKIVMTTGDFNGDGIDDVALGQPGYGNATGRVSILFVNTMRSDSAKDSFEEDFAPWGRVGIQHQTDITAIDAGLSSGSKFGTSLTAARATNYRNEDDDLGYDDLVVGAPSAILGGPHAVAAIGAVVIIKGRTDTSPADFSIATRATLWNPKRSPLGTPVNTEFGAAVTAVPGQCALTGQDTKYFDDLIVVGAPAQSSSKGAIYIYGCSTSGYGNSLAAPSLLKTYEATAVGGRYGHALAGFRIYSGTYHAFVAVGQPAYVGSDGKSSGRMELNEVNQHGFKTLVKTWIPSSHDGSDEFGYALAVHQRPYSDDISDLGGRQTWIGIGMPGAKKDGVRAGAVYAWRPFNSDGTLNSVAIVTSAYNPDPATDTRFGESIADLRPLNDDGGFVAGAPDAITTDDDVEAGQASILQNVAGDYAWTTVRRNLNQETEGDSRPTN